MLDHVTIGADPELFLMKDDEFKSAHGVIPGTKEVPHPVKLGAVQVDGMALEFNIIPSITPDGFRRNISTVMAQLREMIDTEYHLALTACAYFTDEEMERQPPEALLLGCDPDYNAYTEDQNPPVASPGPMRVAGGHVHIGFVSGNDADPREPHFIKSCSNLIKELDAYLGVPSILMDEDHARRRLYGKAGAFRPKTYGVEYRTLSNFWLRNDKTQDWVFRSCLRAVENLKNGHTAVGILNGNGFEDLDPQVIINDNDCYGAERFMDGLGTRLP